MSGITRRQFIKIGGATAGGAAIASGLVTNWWGYDDNPIPDPQTDGDRIVPTFCELCFWRCGLLAHVKNGKVTKLVGNPDHPLSRGRLCPRGAGGTGLLYDPDRLKKPLIRRRKRGQDVFETVSWDKALDYTAEKLLAVRRKHGPEALALFKHGYGVRYVSGCWAIGVAYEKEDKDQSISVSLNLLGLGAIQGSYALGGTETTGAR